jgi:hypothetical protein
MGQGFESTETDGDPGPDDGPMDGRREALFSRHRTDRAGVHGIVRYVFLGVMSVIGTTLLANVIF